MNKSTSDVTINNIIRINDALLRHLSTCDQCHLKNLLKEALQEHEKQEGSGDPTRQQPITIVSYKENGNECESNPWLRYIL